MADPYKVLGVSKDATEKEITAAYRKLAKKYHPDLNPNNPAAAEMMKEVNAAYDAIKNGTASQYNDYSNNTYQQYTYQDFFSGFANGFNQNSQSNDPLYNAEMCIINGQYMQAINILSTIEVRTAHWYYLSAWANYCTGNTSLSLQHAKKAVEMEPNNQQYIDLENKIEQGKKVYSSKQFNFSSSRSSYLRYLLCCMFYLLFGRFCPCFCFI